VESVEAEPLPWVDCTWRASPVRECQTSSNLGTAMLRLWRPTTPQCGDTTMIYDARELGDGVTRHPGWCLQRIFCFLTERVKKSKPNGFRETSVMRGQAPLHGRAGRVMLLLCILIIGTTSFVRVLLAEASQHIQDAGQNRCYFGNIELPPDSACGRRLVHLTQKITCFVGVRP
jgi:hypothetical protein